MTSEAKCGVCGEPMPEGECGKDCEGAGRRHGWPRSFFAASDLGANQVTPSTTNTAALELDEWIQDGDTIPAPIIKACHDAIQREFGDSGTAGYYKRILVCVFKALRATLTQQQGGKCSHMRRFDQICDPCARYPKQQGGEQEAGDELRAKLLAEAEWWRTAYVAAVGPSRCGRVHELLCEAEAALQMLPPRTKQPAASEGDGLHIPRIPTPEMDAAGKQALRDNGSTEVDDSDSLVCWEAMYSQAIKSARNTSKQAAGEAVAPIGWLTDDHLTDRSATTYDKTVADRWVAKGWPITPLYTTPPRHPADEGVAEELAMHLRRAAYLLHTNGMHSLAVQEALNVLATNGFDGKPFGKTAALQAGTP